MDQTLDTLLKDPYNTLPLEENPEVEIRLLRECAPGIWLLVVECPASSRIAVSFYYGDYHTSKLIKPKLMMLLEPGDLPTGKGTKLDAQIAALYRRYRTIRGLVDQEMNPKWLDQLRSVFQELRDDKDQHNQELRQLSYLEAAERNLITYIDSWVAPVDHERWHEARFIITKDQKICVVEDTGREDEHIADLMMYTMMELPEQYLVSEKTLVDYLSQAAEARGFHNADTRRTARRIMGQQYRTHELYRYL